MYIIYDTHIDDNYFFRKVTTFFKNSLQCTRRSVKSFWRTNIRFENWVSNRV